MIRFLEGDCIDVLRTLPDAQFQTCVTSPPYYGLRDYGAAGQIGLEDTPDDYVARLVEVFAEVRRTLRDDGTLWLNLGDSYAGSWGAQGRQGATGQVAGRSVLSAQQIMAHPRKQSGTGSTKHLDGIKPKDLMGMPWMVAFALRADGWWLRSATVWNKPNPMPESITDRPTSAYEMVFLLAKAPRYFYDGEAIKEDAATEAWPGIGPQHATARDRGEAYRPMKAGKRNARNVWTIATQPYKGAHFATMPRDLAERCIKAGSSQAGACPHCGAPWERLLDRCDAAPSGAAIGGDPDRRDGGTRARDPSGRGGNMLATRRMGTETFAQSCACPAHAPIPQAVLDPFGGAGTTALVADRLGRDATLIELNPKYAALAHQRIHGDAPLLVETAAE